VSKVNTTLIGLVLAGGQSRRMGQDKALMRYQGRTLIDNASSLLQAKRRTQLSHCKAML